MLCRKRSSSRFDGGALTNAVHQVGKYTGLLPLFDGSVPCVNVELMYCHWQLFGFD